MNEISAGTWLLAFCTLVGSILGAWLVIGAAGREFHDAVIREIPGMKAQIYAHDNLFKQMTEAAKLQRTDLGELQKVTFELKGMIRMLKRDLAEESGG